MRRLALIPLLAGCIPLLPDVEEPCEAWPDPGLFKVKLERTDSQTRKPYVYVPSSKGPRNLVVLLHGGGMNGTKMEEAANFKKGADELGFVLVYPNGLGWPLRYWNAGPDFEDGHDDVDFLDDLVRSLSPKVCGDRVLATGFSNGAMMVHRWGCQGETVDAIAPVAGPLMVGGCGDGPPVPIREYHGTADPVVPYDGGAGNSIRDVTFNSVEDTIDTWRERNGCSEADPEVTVNGDTTCEAWPCQADTVLCTVDGWGHAWPGGTAASRTDANATQAIYDWFDSLPVQDAE